MSRRRSFLPDVPPAASAVGAHGQKTFGVPKPSDSEQPAEEAAVSPGDGGEDGDVARRGGGVGLATDILKEMKVSEILLWIRSNTYVSWPIVIGMFQNDLIRMHPTARNSIGCIVHTLK